MVDYRYDVREAIEETIAKEWLKYGVDEAYCETCDKRGVTCHHWSAFVDGDYCPGLETETDLRFIDATERW